MGLWIDRYKENEELRSRLEKNIICKDNNLYCHPICIGFVGSLFKCSLFGDLEHNKETMEKYRSNKCMKIFKNTENI